ncbi:Wound-responsive family protein [Quillaja saponaria]|uniref:Wound-responsive family protein n=1 Tax=Quillaja saponaria TaxID=32244 RepID=A0AAD7QH53_QUISA|nr:Wound-responsive family protein [Quillaja saponaria]
MSSAGRAWSVAAASVGVVEALKDQGICRWNTAIMAAQQYTKNHVRSFSQAKKLSSLSSAMVSSKFKREGKAKQSDESLRKVTYLSCWGPN